MHFSTYNCVIMQNNTYFQLLKIILHHFASMLKPVAKTFLLGSTFTFYCFTFNCMEYDKKLLMELTLSNTHEEQAHKFALFLLRDLRLLES